MAYSLLTLEESDGVAIVTLNRPDKRNALSQALRLEIVRCLDEIETNAGSHAVVLTGAAPAFCAGFDRSELASGQMADVFGDATAYHRRVYTFPKPLIAAVNGAALGGGCDLAAMCDIRIAAASASFGQPQVRFGAPAAYDLMQAVIGTGAAREMCVTGRRYDASEALAIGLVRRVVEADDLMEAATAIGKEIATLPAGMARTMKAAFVTSQPRLFEQG